jgi:hypothetical protein
LAEVDRLRGRGVLRLLDLLFVARSQDGAIERLTIGDDEDFGLLLAGVVPGGPGDPAGPGESDGSVPAEGRLPERMTGNRAVSRWSAAVAENAEHGAAAIKSHTVLTPPWLAPPWLAGSWLTPSSPPRADQPAARGPGISSRAVAGPRPPVRPGVTGDQTAMVRPV